MKQFIIEQDANKRDTGAIPQSEVIHNYLLSSSTEKVVNVPTGANIALFAGTGNFFCRFNATVAVPAADITDGSGGELNPVARRVTNVTTIHLISSSNIIVTIAFYEVPSPRLQPSP